MNVAGIYIDSLAVHSVWGAAGEISHANLHGNCKSRDMILSLGDNITSLQGHSFSRQGNHKVCSNFLPWIGSNKTWGLGKSEISADHALEFYLVDLFAQLPPETKVAFSLPIYLAPKQIRRIEQIASKIGMQVQGSLTSASALAIGQSRKSQSLSNCFVVEIDGFGLSLSQVQVVGGVAHLLAGKVFPEFSLHRWVLRLSDFIAEKAVLHCRKDPRVKADTDQALFLQAQKLMANIGPRDSFKVVLEEEFWSQEFVITQTDLKRCFAGMVAALKLQISDFVRPKITTHDDIHLALATNLCGVPGLSSLLAQIISGTSYRAHLPEDLFHQSSICSNAMMMARQLWLDSVGASSVVQYQNPIDGIKVLY
ncbi:MAG: hypothetical protein EBT92_04735 [Planctomycetes bacterium]|nr:hypothetical protein [Planctomycetota bacterium]